MSLGEALDELNERADPDSTVTGTARMVKGELNVDIKGVPADIHSEQFMRGDFTFLLNHFNLDPAVWSVVDSSFVASSWEQSARSKSGDRDRCWLYAYRGVRFQQRNTDITDADVEDLRNRVHKWKPLIRKTPGSGLGPPATLFVGWGDWQIGKSGTLAEVVPAIEASFEATVQRIKDLRKIGRNVESLAIWNMGDVTEAVAGNYSSQTFTVELNRRAQGTLALDLWLAGMRTLAPLVDDLEFGSLLCNHGENREGGKKIAGDSDNESGYLADVLRRVLADRPGFDHIRWTIPHDEMIVGTSMSNVPVGLSHAHTAPTNQARKIEWLRAQSDRLLRTTGIDPRIFLTAHMHHLSVLDCGAFHWIQTPARDAGSKWYTDSSGLWATPGTLTVLVGEHHAAGGSLSGSGRGWSDLAIV